MEAKIVSRPAFTVVGLHYRGKNEENEIPQMWATSGSRLGEIRHVAEQGAAYGVLDHMDYESGTFEYVAGLEVEEAKDVPEGMVGWQIPAQTYAVFTCTLPSIRDSMHWIYDQWLPESRYTRAGGPEFERYGPAFDPTDPASEMEVWIPVSGA